MITWYGICRGQQASGFNPTAGEFVPGGFTPPAPEPAPEPAPAPAPAAEAKEETWESAPNAEPAAAAPAVDELAEEVEKLDLNDEELKKELAAMKAEGLLDEEEEAEITTGKKSVFPPTHFSPLHLSRTDTRHKYTHTNSRFFPFSICLQTCDV